jgi:hypothetical protein
MAQVGLKDFQRLQGRRSVRKYSRIGTDPNETGLGQRTRRPNRLPMSPKPISGCFVLLMVRPQERHQQVDIEQVNPHGKSLRASFTFFIVILGAPFGGLITTRPFTSFTGIVDSNPRRARSDTALPKEMFKDLARFEAASITSSSSVNVVLIV